MHYKPFTQAQPADQELVKVVGLTDPNSPDQPEILTGRWHLAFGLLVLPDLTTAVPRGNCAWRPTRRIVVAPAAFDFDVPTVEEFVAEGNCNVCASTRIAEFYADENFCEMFPTDDDGTEEERNRVWDDLMGNDAPDYDDDGNVDVPLCPNCSQPW